MDPSPATSLPLELPQARAQEKRRSLFRLAWDAARMFVFGFPLYGAMGLLVYLGLLLTAVPLPGRLRKRYTRHVIYRAMAIWAAAMEKVGILKIDFQASEALRGLKGVIIAPNHPSVLDATLFLARLPQITCLMKKSILSNPFMGGSARLAGYLRNDHGPEFIRRGRDALRAGENLLIFPEGTRTVQPPVNGFKKGFALIATLADAPIQTVLIEMPVFFLGKRWPLWRIPHLPVLYTVRTGRVFHPRSDQTAKALGEELEAYFRERIELAGEGVRLKGSSYGQ